MMWRGLVASLFAATTLALGPAWAQDTPVSLYLAGRKSEALTLANAALRGNPNDLLGLYVLIRTDQEAERIDEAISSVELLVRHHPGAAVTWELATQLYQAKGDLAKRDGALRQLFQTQAASLDPTVRLRPFVLRDRIVAGGHVVLVQDYVDTGMPDAIRYAFTPESMLGKTADTYIAVVTDTALTQVWIDAGIIKSGQRVFRLDSMHPGPDGREARATYATYADSPPYDVVRPKVIEILTGKAKPMSGQPGGLALPPKSGG
jgi:tetratricopeptide (TPR) repeat protein